MVIAAAGLEGPEHRPVGGDADIAGRRGLEPAGERPAVDRGDNRLLLAVHAAGEAVEAELDDLADPCGGRVLDDRRDVGLEVGARAERLAGAGEHRRRRPPSSSRKSAQVSIISRWTSGSMALRASGRLIVTQAIRSRFSYRTLLIPLLRVCSVVDGPDHREVVRAQAISPPHHSACSAAVAGKVDAGLERARSAARRRRRLRSRTPATARARAGTGRACGRRRGDGRPAPRSRGPRGRRAAGPRSGPASSPPSRAGAP